MKVGDLVVVKNSLIDIDAAYGTAILIDKRYGGFWTILWKGESLMMHEDYMGAISESR